jgi:prepilin peptidase CpaA
MTTAEGLAVLTVIAACVTDVSASRIPNALTFGAAALAVVFHVAAPAGLGVTHATLGLVVGLAVFFPLFALGAMGAGDVKLMAAVGAWVGWQPVILVALYGSVAGGVLALIVAARSRYLKQAFANIKMLGMYWLVNGVKPLPELTLESKKSVRLPYAVAIAAGLAVTLWRA